ncbi:hypothetical protein [Actinoplanes derwentensis]|uniref:Uncharacterized protein n=1 Tax=Actinoplanes derwentensis TaxID=113562 RepID=A0A1H2AWW3_9ACTN|nr:hypothetical protein [Actinoplanes derwentensis]GID87264.1 hypothetical protein Ade03nite_61880 [Actinoplanes derwentensis]SDT50540.1 hypothetical protein SAMN04489716_4163 [Actinoplanes derwentensis]
MSQNPEPPLLEYQVVIFADGDFGPQFTVMASSLKEARALVIEQHGDGEISIWNEEEARRIR